MSLPGYSQPCQPVMDYVRYRADSSRQCRRCPLSRGLGGFTFSSRHGGQVACKSVPDPKQTTSRADWARSVMRLLQTLTPRRPPTSLASRTE
jgi:hypothetical protein